MATNTNTLTNGTPGLPTFQPTNVGNVQATPSNIFSLIKQSNSQQMSSYLPYIQQWLGSQSQYLQPQLQAIQQAGETNAAAAQSDATKRGLRGSDIEAAGMMGAREAASQNAAQVQAQFGMNQANQMAQYIMQSLGIDIQNNSQMMNDLAQALGQELNRQTTIDMTNKQIDAYKKASKNSMWGNIIGSALGAGAKLI